MKQVISMIVFVLALGSLLTTTLVGVDEATRDRIARNRQRRVYSGVLSALNLPYEADSVEQAFTASVTEKAAGGRTYYVTTSGDVAFEISGMGVWGPVEAVVAMQADLATVKGITVVKHEETPGLGSRIAEPGYLAGFIGKRISPRLSITKEGLAKADNEVDGITGATLSCDALDKILNDELATVIPLIKEAH